MKDSPKPLAVLDPAPRLAKPPVHIPDLRAECDAIVAAVQAKLGRVFDPQFVGAAAAQHGGPFPTVADSLPKGMAKGMPMHCHVNSRRVALRSPRFRYAEGVARPIPDAWGSRLSHAWLVDEEGAVIDRTWASGTDYHGFVVPASTLRAMSAFAVARRRTLCFVTSFEGRHLLREMGVTLEQALKGL